MVRVAVIGAGGIARRHVESLKSISSVKITAINDVVKERAEALAAACGATVYADARACIEKSDVVYVMTPPSLHREQAVLAMEAGKHVVCEKPIASSLDDARAMVDSAQKTGKKLMLGFNMRFRRGGLVLKEMFDSGKLGRVYNYWTHRMGPGLGAAYNWRTDPKLLCGVVIESVSHDIDMVRWIAGEIKDVRATVFESRSDLPGYDTDANIALTLANGTMALIHVSWASPLGHNARGLIGTTGSAMLDGPGMWDWQNLHLKTTDMPYEQVTVINDMLATSASYLDETKHFIECVEKDLQPAATGVDGLKALQVSLAVLASSRDGRVVAVG